MAPTHVSISAYGRYGFWASVLVLAFVTASWLAYAYPLTIHSQKPLQVAAPVTGLRDGSCPSEAKRVAIIGKYIPQV